jgi:hypothetical protein
MSKIDELINDIGRTAEEYRHALTANIARDADRLEALVSSAKQSHIVARIHGVVSKYAPWRIETGPTTFLPIAGERFPLGIRLTSDGEVVIELRAGGRPQVMTPAEAAKWINESAEFSLPIDINIDMCFEKYLEGVLANIQKNLAAQKSRSGRGAS